MWELMQAGKLEGGAATCTGRSMAENLAGCESHDREMIRRFADPLMERAGFLVLKGNLFDFAILKTSVISDAFHPRYLYPPGPEGSFEARPTLFHAPEDRQS